MIDRSRERKNREKWIEFETQTVQIKRRGEETLLAVRNIYLKDIYLNDILLVSEIIEKYFYVFSLFEIFNYLK